MFKPSPRHSHSLYTFYNLIRLGLLLLTLSPLTDALVAQSDKDTRVLELGKLVDRELAGSQSHSYAVTLTSGQYLHIIVEQQGVDVVVALFGPDGKQITEVDSPNGTLGPEPVSTVAETSGIYRLVVRSLEKDAPAGHYQVKLEELRAATEKDKSHVAAERTFIHAELMRARGTAQSLHVAIKEYEESLTHWRAVGDRRGEANTLAGIGIAFQLLGELRKALDFYNQALLLSRAVHDRKGEAETLNNIGTAQHLLGKEREAIDFFNQALPLYRDAGNVSGKSTALHNLGSAYADLGEKKKALDFYYQALTLIRTLGNRSDEARTLNNLAEVYSALGEKLKARDLFSQSLLLRRTVGDRAGEARTLDNLGGVCYALGEKQKALDFFNQALPIYRGLGNRAKEAATLHNIGTIYHDLDENQKALDFFKQAVPVSQSSGDKSGAAPTLRSIGEVYTKLGEKRKALDFLNQALPLYRAAGDRLGIANTLNSIGIAQSGLGEYRESLDHLNRALSLYRAIEDRGGEAAALGNIGLAYSDLGERRKALDFHRQALLIWQALDNRAEQATVLNNIGNDFGSLGEYQKALDALDQSLSLRRAVGSRSGEATVLSNIGAVYNSLGEKQRALGYFNQSLVLWRVVGDRSAEATLLNNIGLVYSNLRESRKALDALNQALSLHQSLGDRPGAAATLINIGALYNALGEGRRALGFFNRALTLDRATGSHSGEATTLNNIGMIYKELGEKRRALGFLNRALSIHQATSHRSGEATTLYNIALTESDRGNLGEAGKKIAAALEITESLRTEVAGQELRTSYFATVQDYYELYVDLLMRMNKQNPSAGYDGAALQTSERARARSLLELLAEAGADIRRGVEPALVERERSLHVQLNAKAQQRMRLISDPRARWQAGTVAEEVERLTTELHLVEARIRQTSPRYAALTQPRPLTLREIQTRVLDRDTLLLEYSLGTARSYLWTVTPTEIKTYQLPKRAEIEAAARSLYELLTMPNRLYAEADLQQGGARSKADAKQQEMLETASRLSHMILGPAASQLGQKRLVIVADGALQYLPFAALPDPATLEQDAGNVEPMIMRHEIVSLPSISILPTLRNEVAGRKPPPKDLVILADPVFNADDERVERNATQNRVSGVTEEAEKAGQETWVAPEGNRFGRLPGTRKEVEGILTLVPAARAKSAMGFEATHALVSGGELSQYRYVHFATHGVLDSFHPELSAVVLSLVDKDGNPQDGFLRAHEVYNLNLPADVVTLSGCETGLGKEIRGEGLIGLTRGFMYAGAARVVVSLWGVNDEATAELMVRFYTTMIKGGRRPADALRVAQIEMFKQGRWRSPYYWAAFVLQGEWN